MAKPRKASETKRGVRAGKRGRAPAKAGAPARARVNNEARQDVEPTAPKVVFGGAAAPATDRVAQLRARIGRLEQELGGYQAIMRQLLTAAAEAQVNAARTCRCGAALGTTNASGLCAFCEAMERA